MDHRLRFAVLAAAVVVIVSALNPVRASANEITLIGSTSGIFSASGTNALSPGLTFNASSFNQGTSGGFAALNLGSFSLNSANGGYSGNFTVDVNFTEPTGISGGGSSNFDAHVMGSVSNGAGGATVFDFDPASEVFNFSNSTETGYFTFDIPSFVSVLPGNSVGLNGFVDYVGGPTVPEPPSIVLALSGLLGIFIVKRRVFA
jgi:hypothetical protein